MNKQERDELRQDALMALHAETAHEDDLTSEDVNRLFRHFDNAKPSVLIKLIDQLDAYESVVEAARDCAVTTEGLCLKSVKNENDLDKRELLKSALQSSRQTIKSLEYLEDE